MTRRKRKNNVAMMEVRAVVVLLLSVLTGVGAAVLAHEGGVGWPWAIIVGGSVIGGAVVFYDRLVA